MSITEADKQYIWHPYTQMGLNPTHIPIVRGSGAYLYDENGTAYLDAISSWWVNIHGHAHPYIAQKVSEQLNTLEHVIFAGFTHPTAVSLAQRLMNHLPKNQRKIFYSDNGSTAVEVALKMALQYWFNIEQPRTRFIAFENAYHGDTFGAMSISGRGAFTAPFNELLFDVSFLPVPVPGMEEESLDKFDQYLKVHGKETAAFIFEPLVQGTAGMVMYEAQWLDKLIALCRQYGILIIADEVMTGFGRTGTFFASHQITQQPDMCCLSKGLTGGTMALGITSCGQSIFDAFYSTDKLKTLFHGHSFTANPVACSAALASLDLMEMPETTANLARIEQSHRQFADSIRNQIGVKHCRVKGTIFAVELETGSGTTYFNTIRDQLYAFFMSEHILLRPLGNIIYIMPPYCITNEELNRIYKTIEQAIKRFAQI